MNESRDQREQRDVVVSGIYDNADPASSHFVATPNVTATLQSMIQVLAAQADAHGMNGDALRATGPQQAAKAISSAMFQLNQAGADLAYIPPQKATISASSQNAEGGNLYVGLMRDRSGGMSVSAIGASMANVGDWTNVKVAMSGGAFSPLPTVSAAAAPESVEAVNDYSLTTHRPDPFSPKAPTPFDQANDFAPARERRQKENGLTM